MVRVSQGPTAAGATHTTTGVKDSADVCRVTDTLELAVGHEDSWEQVLPVEDTHAALKEAPEVILTLLPGTKQLVAEPITLIVALSAHLHLDRDAHGKFSRSLHVKEVAVLALSVRVLNLTVKFDPSLENTADEITGAGRGVFEA